MSITNNSDEVITYDTVFIKQYREDARWVTVNPKKGTIQPYEDAII